MYYNYIILIITINRLFALFSVRLQFLISPKYTAGVFTLMIVFIKVKMLCVCLNKGKPNTSVFI